MAKALLLTLLLASEQVSAFSLGGVRQTRARALARQAVPLAQEFGEMPAAYIEFIIGVPEPCIPDVKLTRSRDGSTGVATFTFDNPSFLAAASAELGETTGMYLKDDEGTLSTTEVTANFINGKPRIVKGVVVMKTEGEWDRFMRFMERYGQANGLGFAKA
uniref:Photosystem II reaction center Psb28 protein n=1 Tax=Phaeocystis antarctica TaxID=33657 RepID=A0A7S0H7V2_9EUKA|mmetsp:Transcript_10171/g.23920  ORF Transcript_10171/g.23920 Transcript_10171/m.23920 type:complete len:161 (+) Transcript_10171:51-533(+)